MKNQEIIDAVRRLESDIRGVTGALRGGHCDFEDRESACESLESNFRYLKTLLEKNG